MSAAATNSISSSSGSSSNTANSKDLAAASGIINSTKSSNDHNARVNGAASLLNNTLEEEQEDEDEDDEEFLKKFPTAALAIEQSKKSKVIKTWEDLKDNEDQKTPDPTQPRSTTTNSGKSKSRSSKKKSSTTSEIENNISSTVNNKNSNYIAKSGESNASNGGNSFFRMICDDDGDAANEVSDINYFVGAAATAGGGGSKSLSNSSSKLGFKGLLERSNSNQRASNGTLEEESLGPVDSSSIVMLEETDSFVTTVFSVAPQSSSNKTNPEIVFDSLDDEDDDLLKSVKIDMLNIDKNNVKNVVKDNKNASTNNSKSNNNNTLNAYPHSGQDIRRRNSSASNSSASSYSDNKGNSSYNNDDDEDITSLVKAKPVKAIVSMVSSTFGSSDPALYKDKLPKELKELGKMHPLRVLVVEDNLIVQKTMVRQVQLLGYTTVETANHGVEVVKLYQIGRLFDVILMDLHMPEMDGLATARYIKEKLEGWKKPTIVAVTASESAEESLECILLGISYYITKPIPITLLTDIFMKCERIKEPAISKPVHLQAPRKEGRLGRKNSM